MAYGLFVGLVTLDCIYRVDRVPTSDEKVVARDCLFLAGGPATNAAVAFRWLDQGARLWGAVGQHPLTSLIRADLAEQGVDLLDGQAQTQAPPPLSTILITAATGQRAVISRNAVGRQLDPPASLDDLLDGVDIVLIDGHQMALGQAIARLARQRDIPVVIDAGSWKPGFDTLLPLATSVIAAERFRLPGQTTAKGTRLALSEMSIPEIATTNGDAPIQFCHHGEQGEVPVPAVTVVDTLGAGDILHGAFCHYRLRQAFPVALARAAVVASQSCQYFGPRAWRQQTL